MSSLPAAFGTRWSSAQDRWNRLRVLLAQGALVPVGAIFPTLCAEAPEGYLMCEGQAISRTEYPELFKRMSTKGGVGDGSTTFNLPDLRGRVPVGADGSAGRLSEKDALGETGGTEKHTLTTAQIPAHSHPNASYAPGGVSYGYTIGGGFVGFTNSGDAGGGQSHPNMQPYQIVNYVIRAT